MSQTLTQPEEIDSIWRAMAWLDSEAGAKIQEGASVNGGVYGFDGPWAASSNEEVGAVGPRLIR